MEFNLMTNTCEDDGAGGHATSNKVSRQSVQSKIYYNLTIWRASQERSKMKKKTA